MLQIDLILQMLQTPRDWFIISLEGIGMTVLNAIAEETDRGRMLKSFVRGKMGVSYAQYSAAKREGGICVNGKAEHANYPLNPGDCVQVNLPENGREGALPEFEPVAVPYEDDDILIIEKPAPLACQCSPKQPGGTLENRLAGRYGSGFVFRPLNRLDRGTSGLMAAAKHAHAYQRLQKQLHTDAFVREYLAVVEGEWSGEGTIDLPIAKENDATVRRIINFESGKRAVTHYRVLESGKGRALVRLRLETGRTHQIRVHLSQTGHPIAGDFLYGTEISALPGRFALHSAHIELNHPMTGARIRLDSPLPEELKKLL